MSSKIFIMNGSTYPPDILDRLREEISGPSENKTENSTENSTETSTETEPPKEYLEAMKFFDEIRKRGNDKKETEAETVTETEQGKLEEPDKKFSIANCFFGRKVFSCFRDDMSVKIKIEYENCSMCYLFSDLYRASSHLDLIPRVLPKNKEIKIKLTFSNDFFYVKHNFNSIDEIQRELMHYRILF